MFVTIRGCTGFAPQPATSCGNCSRKTQNLHNLISTRTTERLTKGNFKAGCREALFSEKSGLQMSEERPNRPIRTHPPTTTLQTNLVKKQLKTSDNHSFRNYFAPITHQHASYPSTTSSYDQQWPLQAQIQMARWSSR